MLRANLLMKIWGLWMIFALLISACDASPTPTSTVAPISTTATPQMREGVLPKEEELAALLVRMVDEEKRATGMVIGMVAPGEKVIVGYGSLNKPGGPVPDSGSLFEIGSISKVFIGTLLADSVQRGEVRLEDPAGMYLPAGVKMPAYNGTPVTLLDLATHTSGLPREIATDEEMSLENWKQVMYDFLSAYQLPHAPGTKFEYSNLGMTLLAHILELRTGTAYEQLVAERILQPLGMASTSFGPSKEMLSRLATGHNSVLYPVDAYVSSVPEHVYVGAIISSAEDMLKFASAAMGLEPSLLLPAFQDAMKPRRFALGDKSGLAWRVVEGKRPILYHAGHTFGMHAYLGLDTDRKVAVIVLANAAIALDDIGPHLLHPERNALKKFTPRAAITPIVVDPAVLASYQGKYQFGDMVASIEVNGHQLVLSMDDQQPLTLIPEQETRFVLVEYDATIQFLVDAGKVSGLILRQADTAQTYTFLKVEPAE